MTSATLPTIAPCPFCGRKWRQEWDQIATWLQIVSLKPGDTLTEVAVFVRCPACHAHTVRVFTRETDLTWAKISAINFWNRRDLPEADIE